MSAFFVAHNVPWWLAMIITWVIYTVVGGTIYGTVVTIYEWIKGKVQS